METELRTGQFRRFWTAQTLSQIGERFGLVGIPVVAVLTLNADSRQVGLLSACLTVCYLVVGLPAGAWVDRWSKRTTMMRAAVVRAVILAVIPLAWALDVLRLEFLYSIGIVVGIASVFFDVAYQSLVPFVVNEEALESANSRLEASAQISAAGGPAIAGALFAVVSAPFVFIIDVLAYLGCAVLLRGVRDNEPLHEQAGSSTSLRADVMEGMRFVLGHPVLRRLCMAVGVSNFFATIVMTLLPLLILRELDLGATVMGLALGVGTLGGLTGAVLLPKVRRRLRVGTVMTAGLATAGLSTTAFPAAALFSSEVPVLAALVLILGQFGMTFGAVMFNISQISVRQRMAPKNLLGRTNASIRFVVWGTMPLAALVAGWMATVIGIVPCMWIGVAGAFLTVAPILGMDKLITTDSAPVPGETSSV